MRDEDWWQMVEKITCEDVKQFFNTVPGKGCCPICKNELVSFKAIERLNRDIREIPDKPAISWKTVHDAAPPFERIQIPTLTSVCDVCGFMANFSFHSLLEWKARSDH